MINPQWQALIEHQKIWNNIKMQDLFQKDPHRFSAFSLELEEILFDFSKQKVLPETIQRLCALAEACGLSEKRQALFAGEKVNATEKRPALHTALRDTSHTPLILQGQDIKLKIHTVLERMGHFVEAVHSGEKRGATGLPFTDVLSLGIGGSELGPMMVSEALNAYKTSSLNVHFISNVDGHTLASLLTSLNPATTLCIANSKTFTTQETLTNLNTVKAWFNTAFQSSTMGDNHCVAVTAEQERARAYGILPEHIFPFWDFVGGRYSVWSAVGLPIALQLGRVHFRAFLQGAECMDKHFYSAPFDKNMPVLMGLLGIWNINFWGTTTHLIMPYDNRLAKFPNYMQQLEMESNGKRVAQDGCVLPYATAPIIWGGVGCNGQHAYMQLLHQGSHVVPVDFLIAAKGNPKLQEQHRVLLASCFSQSKALMEGTCEAASASQNTTDTLFSHKFYPGNRPSSTLVYPELTPKILGALIALYEHKVFVQSVIWNINPFDQWGVELGKTITNTLLNRQKENTSDVLDSSTAGLLAFVEKRSTPTT